MSCQTGVSGDLHHNSNSRGLRTTSGVPTPRIPPSVPRNIWSEEEVLDRFGAGFCFIGVKVMVCPMKRLLQDDDTFRGDVKA